MSTCFTENVCQHLKLNGPKWTFGCKNFTLCPVLFTHNYLCLTESIFNFMGTVRSTTTDSSPSLFLQKSFSVNRGCCETNFCNRGHSFGRFGPNPVINNECVWGVTHNKPDFGPSRVLSKAAGRVFGSRL